MALSRLFPEFATGLAVEDVYGDLDLPTSKTRSYVLINMVASLDGKASVGGKASPLGSETDRALMRALRARADAVMTGAGTLRAEKLTLAVPEKLARARASRGLKPQPLAVVATGSGNVPLVEHLIYAAPDNLLILAAPDTPKERLSTLASLATVEVLPELPRGKASQGSRLDLVSALETLKERYAVDVLLVEGGPALNHSLVTAGLADELFLTLAPKLTGGSRYDSFTLLDGPSMPPGETSPRLLSIHLHEDELFLRYDLRPSKLA